MSDAALTDPPLRSEWDIVGGLRIHARVSASPAPGRPIVFVHGLGVSSRYMEPTVSRLAATFAAIITNFARHGMHDAVAAG